MLLDSRVKTQASRRKAGPFHSRLRRRLLAIAGPFPASENARRRQQESQPAGWSYRSPNRAQSVAEPLTATSPATPQVEPELPSRLPLCAGAAISSRRRSGCGSPNSGTGGHAAMDPRPAAGAEPAVKNRVSNAVPKQSPDGGFDSQSQRVIAIGNGTACREQELVAELIDEHSKIWHTIVQRGRECLFGQPCWAGRVPISTPRAARFQSAAAARSLSELVKIEPQNIGWAFTSRISSPEIEKIAGRRHQSCVNQVGVDLNTASVSLLKHTGSTNWQRELVDYRANMAVQHASSCSKFRELVRPVSPGCRVSQDCRRRQSARQNLGSSKALPAYQRYWAKWGWNPSPCGSKKS